MSNKYEFYRENQILHVGTKFGIGSSASPDLIGGISSEAS